ncbi:hypothetical protein [Streptomyces sp. NPDC059452]|uniref:hypothetical protein n=1 Tax=Streptomyces sp. NPDC059452 TaxID=3346835 RepID=UPI0036B2FD8A
MRALERVVSAYAGADGVAMPGEIRRNLGRALTHYPRDLNDILGKNVDYSVAEFSTEPNDVNVSYRQMLGFIESVAKDREAFDIVYDSQAAQVADFINSLTREDLTRTPAAAPDRALGTAQEAGYVMGSLYGTRAPVSVSDGLDVDAKRYGWPRLEGMLRARTAQLRVRQDGERVQELLRQAKSTFNDAK